jgi:hypothetical protein
MNDPCYALSLVAAAYVSDIEAPPRAAADASDSSEFPMNWKLLGLSGSRRPSSQGHISEFTPTIIHLTLFQQKSWEISAMKLLVFNKVYWLFLW